MRVIDNALHSAIHPGEIVREEFLVPRGMAAQQLAVTTGISAGRIQALLAGHEAVTEEIAEALSLSLGMNRAFWLSLQRDYEQNHPH